MERKTEEDVVMRTWKWMGERGDWKCVAARPNN